MDIEGKEIKVTVYLDSWTTEELIAELKGRKKTSLVDFWAEVDSRELIQELKDRDEWNEEASLFNYSPKEMLEHIHKNRGIDTDSCRQYMKSTMLGIVDPPKPDYLPDNIIDQLKFDLLMSNYKDMRITQVENFISNCPTHQYSQEV